MVWNPIEPTNMTPILNGQSTPIPTGRSTDPRKDRTTVPRLVFPPEILEQARSLPYMEIKVIEYRPMVRIKDSLFETAKTRPNDALEGQVEWDLRGRSFDGLTPIDKSTATAKEQIILAIPQNVQDNFTVAWDMNDQRVIQSGLQALSGVKDSGSLNDLLKAVGGGASNIGLGVFGNSAKAFTGYAANPRKQALFEGVEHRVFTFDFIFTPRDEREAKQIIEIIRCFKKNSAPRKAASGAMLQFPKQFLISFKNVQGFPEIDACVCLNVSHNYTTAGLQLLSSGHSVQIAMSITFQETTLRTEEFPGI